MRQITCPLLVKIQRFEGCGTQQGMKVQVLA
jgi:hypothetical protein